MRQRVYVAGPISKGPLEANIRQATEAGLALLKAGFAPLIPHLTCYLQDSTPRAKPCDTTVEDWYEADLPWVAVCDAILRLPGESTGADLEVALAQSLGIPVFTSVADLVANPPARGDERFLSLLREMELTHKKKSRDYGTGDDPLANLRASTAWGIPPWLGALCRGTDKVVRLQTYARTGKLACEGVEDSLLDLAAYAMLSLVLFREEQSMSPEAGRP